MCKALPGCRGLFSQLQYAFTHSKGNRVRLNTAARDHLEDFQLLADDLCERPTRLGQVVLTYPAYKGTVDAAKSGMGGVWLPAATNPAHPSLVWRQELPVSVREAVITDQNFKGTVTNSDLELVGPLPTKLSSSTTLLLLKRP
jgi:hypothetical protein